MSFNREQTEKKFWEEYEKLNEKQRIAVDTLEGPVMVIAGPGTGKTQILASRVGKILLEGLAHAENILCLTYTDAGAIAMRKRLIQLIGPDAYKVNIYTFHAFCNEVIQDNLSLFEKTALDPISDLEKIELYKELIDSFPKNHPLKRYRGDVYFEIHNLDRLFSTMKREGWTPDFINQKIDEYIASLPFREEFIYKKKYKEFKAGDLKKDRLEEEINHMEKLRAAVNEFPRFQQMMYNKKRYDFDDMINWVIRAFEENKNLLARYQEQFLYILVDEYQDTSGAQNRIVELLINYWDKPNVFVVGDDDQSIYRFQGANVENMLEFADQYKDALKTVVLTHNYRSTQPILDVSRSLISQNRERLVTKIKGLSKELISSNPAINHLSAAPQLREYETQRQEMIDITLQVQQLLAQQVSPGDIAVLYKENRYGEDLADYFRLRKIPYYSKRDLNLLELPLTQKIILLLRYLATEHDMPYSGDELLFELLHFDWFHIPAIEIARLSVEAAEKKYTDRESSLRKLLYEKSNAPAKDLFSVSVHDGLKNASALLENFISLVSNLTLQHLVEKIIRETGILNQVFQSPDKHFQLQILTGFFDFIKEETRRKPLLGLKELVNILDLMIKEDLRLPLVQVSGTEKGVNLLTVHGAKGLEFMYVFIAGCNATFWERKKKPYSGYKLPDTVFASKTTLAATDTLADEGDKLKSTGLRSGGNPEDEEELRRLFYVAVTRAKQHLRISYSKFKNDGKELEPSVFIEEIKSAHQLPVEKIFISNDVLSEFATLHFTEAPAPEMEKTEQEFIDKLLEKFVMNVTALNNYLKCPLEFYYKNLIRIPSPKNEATEFGSAVHYALEKLFRKMLGPDGRGSEQRSFPAKEEFIADFQWYMHRHRESFTKDQFARRLEYGQEVLGNYYQNYVHQFNKIVVIEKNISTVIDHQIPIKGKLDKLEFEGKTVNVVDYKTGDPQKGLAKLNGPTNKDPLGGDYWRQAVFYKILVDHYTQKDWKAGSAEFDFIEPDSKKIYHKKKLIISPEEVEVVTQQIRTVWEKIQNHEFYIGCGKPDCHWCQFVKSNNLAVSLQELEEEESES